MKWFDTHAHPHLSDELGVESVNRAIASGVAGMVCIGCDRATSLASRQIAVQFPGQVFASVGLHPHEASFGVESIVDLVCKDDFIAIGEAGLDYFYEHSDRDQQKKAFAEQIELAKQYDLALIIHSRDAWDDTFSMLKECGTPPRTVFHCFTGGPTEAEKALELGTYLSYSGIVTFKNAEQLRQAALITPLDRICIETDAPYLAPVPHRGKTNEPAYVSYVGEFLAKHRDIDAQTFASMTYTNSLKLFDLPKPDWLAQ